MAGQTQMNAAQERRSSPARAVGANTRLLASDALELAELQVRMFATDGRQCARRSLLPLLTISIGLALLLSAFPFLLLALMHVLTVYMKFETWLAVLCSGGAGIVLGALLAAVGIAWLRPQLRLLGHSFAELNENLQWLRSALRRDGSKSNGTKEN